MTFKELWLCVVAVDGHRLADEVPNAMLRALLSEKLFVLATMEHPRLV